MATFGQSITPRRLVLDLGDTGEELTRLKFFRRLVRCMCRVGMELHSCSSPWPHADQVSGGIVDENPAFSETDTAGPFAASVAILTFPTAETFDRIIEGSGYSYTVTYRPCIFVSMSTQEDTASLTGTVDRSAINIYLDAGAVPWGGAGPYQWGNCADVGDMLTRNGLATVQTGQGYTGNSLYNLAAYTGTPRHVNYSGFKGGLRVYLDNWKSWSGDSGSRTGLLRVGYWDVSLGKGGLHIMVGRSARDKRTYMNGGFLFHGERIPNRARIPANDTNLRHICPVSAVFAAEDMDPTQGTPYWVKTVYLRVNNGQYDPAEYRNPGPVQTWDSAIRGEAALLYPYVFNRHNLSYKSKDNWLAIDGYPTKTIGGSARFVAQRLILFPSYGDENWNNTSHRPGSTASWDDRSVGQRDVIHADWEDAWHFPSVRLIGHFSYGNNSNASLGNFVNLTDPDTSKLWRVMTLGSQYGDGDEPSLLLDVTGETVYTSIPAWTYTGTSSFSYTFNAVPSGALTTQPPSVSGTPPTQLATPILTSPSNLYVANTGAVGPWAKSATQTDSLESVNATNASNTTTLEVYIDLPPGTDSRFDFYVAFELFLSAPATNANFTAQFDTLSPSTGAYTNKVNIQQNNAFVAYGPFNVKAKAYDSPNATSGSRLRFQFRNVRVTSAAGTQTMRVRNITITAKRLQTEP